MIPILRAFCQMGHEGQRHAGVQPARLGSTGRPCTNGGLGTDTSHDDQVNRLGRLTSSFAGQLTTHWSTISHDPVLFELARTVSDLIDGLASGDDITALTANLHALEAQLPQADADVTDTNRGGAS